MTGYALEIAEAAQRHGLPADIVAAVVMQESSGRTYAYRYEPAFWRRYLEGKPEWAGANPERVSASYGLMQIMYPVAREVGLTSPDPEHLFVPTIGLEYGCRKLAQLWKWADSDMSRALAAYNGGPVGNERAPFRNQGYVDAVYRHLTKGTLQA